MLTVFKGYKELHMTGSLPKIKMAKPDILDDLTDYVKNSEAWNSTSQYG